MEQKKQETREEMLMRRFGKPFAQNKFQNRKPHIWTPELAQKLKSMHDSGLTYTQIGRVYNIHASSIRRAVLSAEGKKA